MRLKQSDGSFRMHEDGEVDVRGSYCALSVAHLVCINTTELTQNMGSFIASCQTYEGGIGGVPGVEAHGRYAFCGFAALSSLNQISLLDVDRFMHWCVSRQMEDEGGFQGRTNKLVDGCYSFWMGGIFPILSCYLQQSGEKVGDLMDRIRLQEYLLYCCQSERGGMRDKPGKSSDFYHTCYCLSGLSVAQHSYEWNQELQQIQLMENTVILGDARNQVEAIHPIYNLKWGKAEKIQLYFKNII